MSRRQITTEFEHRWVEMPASHEAAWWAGISAVVDLVRQEAARRASVGVGVAAEQDVSVVEKIPMFTFSPPTAPTGTHSPVNTSVMAENTHYPTSGARSGAETQVWGTVIPPE